jgi:hypothetical protein
MNYYSCAWAVRFVRALKHCRVRHLLILSVLLAGLPLLTYGQATVLGTVTDPSGSVVPNVAITVTQIETGETRTSTTNGAGEYVTPDLAIGHYTIGAKASGFNGEEKTDILLQIGDRTRIDFVMRLGKAEERVTVEAEALKIQTDSGEVSDVITGQQVAELATNGRSMYTLSDLTPGASSLQNDFQVATSAGGDANVSFNGLREGHNIYLIDGGEDDDRGGGGGSSVMPSMDAIAEFRELTSNYSADYGLSSAASISTVIKSGTKTLHATGWWFGRNNALDARNFFNPAPNPVAELRFNTEGFNVGGQVPAFKSHPTFFFYNMEWRELIQGGLLNQPVPTTSEYSGVFPSTIPITVPTAAIASASVLARNCPGDTLPAGVVQGSPFPGNAIPSCMIDPNATSVLQAGIFPAPTTGTSFQGGNNSPTTVREEIARVDHQFSDKFSIFGHWISEQVLQGYGTSQWSGDNVPTAHNTFGNPSYSAVIHTTYVINSNLLNEASFNYNGNRIAILPEGIVSAPSSFGFNRVFTGPNADDRIPSIKLDNTGTNYTTNWMPWNNIANDYQLRDDISLTKGTHQIKFGASWALYKKVQNVFANTQGGFDFNGLYTGNDFADFLLGTANGYTEDAVHDSGHWNNISPAVYVQDNWRATHRLTLNLGLRWDGIPHTYEANNRASDFYPSLYNPSNAAVFLPDGTIDPVNTPAAALGTSPNSILAGYQFYLNGVGVAGKNGISNGLVKNSWAAFGPRLGVAYDLTGNGKTVLRGGFGIMYERIQGNDMYDAATDVPFSANATFSNVLLSNPKTNVATGVTISPSSLPIVVASITGLSANNYKLPTSYQYSAGVQHEFRPGTVLSLAYVGNQNHNQNEYIETNLPPLSDIPGLLATNGAAYNQEVQYLGFRSIKMAEDVANSHYNSFQAELHEQLRGGLSVQVAYTWARAIDPTTGGGNSYDLDAVSNPYVGSAYDQGPSIFDRTNVGFANFVYPIPFLKNSENALLRSVVGGWAVSGIVLIESGAPLNVSLASGTLDGQLNICNVVQNCSNRPDVSGPISYPHTVGEWFNTAAFTAPASGTFGDLTRNALRGPGRDNWNLSIHKDFMINAERGSMFEIRIESFNTFNHPQFKGDDNNGGIGTTFGGSNFGVITSAYDPREFQLGAKLFF